VTWKVIGPEGTRFEGAPRAALEEVPDAALNPAGPLFPQERHEGRCRLCGQTALLTQEHVPPRSAWNKERARTHTLDDWLARTDLHDLPGGRVVQGGNRGYTLCGPCNSFTGTRYGDEYKAWAVRAMTILQQLPLGDLDAKPVSPTVQDVGFVSVDPGAFIRQVLSMMCTVGAGWGLADIDPIRAIVLEGRPDPLPDGMAIWLSFYAGPRSRVVGPTLVVDPTTLRWSWVLEIAHPPLATLMRLRGSAEPPPLVEISEFTTMPPGRTGAYEANFALAFGNTVYPGDYRTSGEIIAEREASEAARRKP
jgi:hypothetical protein